MVRDYHPTIREFFPDSSSQKRWEEERGTTLAAFERRLGRSQFAAPNRKVMTRATVAKAVTDSRMVVGDAVRYIASLAEAGIEVV